MTKNQIKKIQAAAFGVAIDETLWGRKILTSEPGFEEICALQEALDSEDWPDSDELEVFAQAWRAAIAFCQEEI